MGWFKSKKEKLEEEIEYQEIGLAWHQGQYKGVLDAAAAYVAADQYIPVRVSDSWVSSLGYIHRHRQRLIFLNKKLNDILTKELNKFKQVNAKLEDIINED